MTYVAGLTFLVMADCACSGGPSGSKQEIYLLWTSDLIDTTSPKALSSAGL